MAVSNGVLAAAAVVIVAAVGVATYVGLQDVRDLRHAVGEISAKLDKTDAAATLASTTATQAKETADQARALATAAKETADRTAAAAAGSAGLATASPAPAQQSAPPAASSDIMAGREVARLICATCHVVSPDQSFAPTRSPPGPDFHDIANWPSTTDKTLHDFLLKPHGKMPDLRLPDFQVTALVDYMMSLRDHR